MDYNKLIDHTNLKQDAQEADIIKLCDEAKEHHFASVCVNPNYVSLCKERLADSDVKVCTVIGFPLGQTTTTAKIDETKDAIFEGADEIDMVINVSWIKDKRYDKVLYEIQRLKRYCHDRILKVILETMKKSLKRVKSLRKLELTLLRPPLASLRVALLYMPLNL